MPKASVLVVEDNPMSRATAMEILQDLGLKVFGAYCAHEALAVLKDRPDIGFMFIDVRMPGMSGAELAQAVRRAHPHIQIVLTSGYVREDEVPTGFPFIAKPWQPGDVKSAFEPALRS